MITYVFDLDNSLYPASSKSEQMRVNDHTNMVQQALGLKTTEEALEAANNLYKEHGTTFAGLAKVSNITFEEFHNFSNVWDYTEIHDEDKELESLIKQLDGKKYIYSAGNRTHVIKTLAALGIDINIFDGVFGSDDGDIMRPKPQKATQEIFIEKFNIDKSSVIFFDDSISCINSSVEDGWNKCVLVNNGNPVNTHHEQTSTVKEYLKKHF